jgi:hypothetical protein
MDAGLDTTHPGAFGSVEQTLQADESRPDSYVVERPAGITLIAVVYFILGAIVAIEGAIAIVSYAAGRTSLSAALTFFLFDIIGALFAFLFAVGYWRLWDWTRVVTIFFAFFLLLAGGPSDEWWLRGIDIALIVYLMSPKVRALFYEAGEHEHVAIVDRWLRRRFDVSHG